jgi:hypothetical protein
VTYPGLGGQQPPPLNSSPAGQLVPGVTPGVSGGIVRARQVIISGANEALYVYSGAPAAGSLIYSVTQGTAADPYGNRPPGGGAVSYNNESGTFFAVNMFSAGLIFFTAASEAGPWTNQGSISLLLAGSDLALQFSAVKLTSGASTTIPISSAGFTTVAQVVAALVSVGIFS